MYCEKVTASSADLLSVFSIKSRAKKTKSKPVGKKRALKIMACNDKRVRVTGVIVGTEKAFRSPRDQGLLVNFSDQVKTDISKLYINVRLLLAEVKLSDGFVLSKRQWISAENGNGMLNQLKAGDSISFDATLVMNSNDSSGVFNEKNDYSFRFIRTSQISIYKNELIKNV